MSNKRGARVWSDKDLNERCGRFEDSAMSICDAIKPPEDFFYGGDRFSSLPDAVAYHILNFVDVVDFKSLIEVSQRWSRLCFSAPYLSMGNSTFTRVSTYRADFLAQYFSDRGKAGGAKIEKLRIVWSFLQPEQPQGYGRGKRKREHNFDDADVVFTCLRKCVSCCDPENVELNLVLRDGECCKPPLSLFFHKDIRNLVLSMNNSALIIRSWHHVSKRLQNLTLKSVKIRSKSFGTLISSHQCPNLKQLRLYECSGVEYLIVCNNSVEHVEIVQEKNCSDLSRLAVFCDKLQTLLITWYPKSFTHRPLLELYVPEVEHLEWKGFPLRIFSFELLEHIKSASIYCTWPTGKSLDMRYASDLYDFFAVMRMTKSLRLLSRTIEILFSDWRKQKFVYSLEGVETLQIDDCYLTGDEVPAIAFILKMMPELKDIYVSFSKAIAHTRLEVSGFKMNYWEAQDMKSIKQLKTATLEIHKEGNATEFVKYLAKHGERLKRLKVICPPAMVSAVSGQVELMKSVVGRSFICDVQSSEP